VPFTQVFAGELNKFRDVNFGTRPGDAIDGSPDRGIHGRPRLRQSASLVAGLLLGMAEDLGAIRQQLDAQIRDSSAPASSFWIPR
jgi:hypothetical protein